MTYYFVYSANAERQTGYKWKNRGNEKDTNYSVEAIVAYSDSLEAIVSSGNQGAQAGSELADSIQEFAEAAGVTSHKQVVNALKNRWPVSTTSLLEAAVEIQYLIKSVREL